MVIVMTLNELAKNVEGLEKLEGIQTKVLYTEADTIPFQVHVALSKCKAKLDYVKDPRTSDDDLGLGLLAGIAMAEYGSVVFVTDNDTAIRTASFKRENGNEAQFCSSMDEAVRIAKNVPVKKPKKRRIRTEAVSHNFVQETKVPAPAAEEETPTEKEPVPVPENFINPPEDEGSESTDVQQDTPVQQDAPAPENADEAKTAVFEVDIPEEEDEADVADIAEEDKSRAKLFRDHIGGYSSTMVMYWKEIYRAVKTAKSNDEFKKNIRNELADKDLNAENVIRTLSSDYVILKTISG